MPAIANDLNALPQFPVGPSDPNEEWDWGIPSWRDASLYPDPDNTFIHVWRWQFLRRDKAYRTAWCAYCVQFQLESVDESAQKLIARKFNLSTLLDPAETYVHDGFGFGVIPEQFAGSVIPAIYGSPEVNNFVALASQQG